MVNAAPVVEARLQAQPDAVDTTDASGRAGRAWRLGVS
jgi:hypothetical protein